MSAGEQIGGLAHVLKIQLIFHAEQVASLKDICDFTAVNPVFIQLAAGGRAVRGSAPAPARLARTRMSCGRY